MMINNCVTGLCIYCTVLFIIILGCTPTYKKKCSVKQYAMLRLQSSALFRLLSIMAQLQQPNAMKMRAATVTAKQI